MRLLLELYIHPTRHYQLQRVDDDSLTCLLGRGRGRPDAHTRTTDNHHQLQDLVGFWDPAGFLGEAGGPGDANDRSCMDKGQDTYAFLGNGPLLEVHVYRVYDVHTRCEYPGCRSRGFTACMHPHKLEHRSHGYIFPRPVSATPDQGSDWRNKSKLNSDNALGRKRKRKKTRTHQQPILTPPSSPPPSRTPSVTRTYLIYLVLPPAIASQSLALSALQTLQSPLKSLAVAFGRAPAAYGCPGSP